MRKFITLALIFVCITGLVGCGNKDVDAEVNVPTDATESVTDTDIQKPEINEIEPEDTDVVHDESIIETKYFVIDIPDSWSETCVYEAREKGDVAVYEKQGKENHDCGKLFMIMLINEGQDYSMYPEYDVLGTIETDYGKCSVVVIYPTDVQFVSETAETYQSMNAEVKTIIDSIKFKDGTNFAKAN